MRLYTFDPRSEESSMKNTLKYVAKCFCLAWMLKFHDDKAGKAAIKNPFL